MSVGTLTTFHRLTASSSLLNVKRAKSHFSVSLASMGCSSAVSSATLSFAVSAKTRISGFPAAFLKTSAS